MPGHRSEGFGAAHVQRRGRAEVGEPGGTGRERGVQVQGVGQVDLGLHPHGALEGHLVRCARGRAGRPRRPPGAAGPRSGMNRTIASSTSRSTPLGRIRCANPATWSSTNPAAARLSAIVCAGDPAGPPRRQVPGPDPGPGPREPVPQLEGLTEVGLAGLGGQPDRGRELRHTELRHQRRTGSGDRDRGVTEPDRSPIDSAGCRSAQAQACAAGPPRRRRRLPGGPARARGPRLRCRGSRVLVAGHGPILVEQVFESSVESVDIRRGNIGDPKVGLRRFGRLSRPLRNLLNHRQRPSHP